MQIRLSKIFPLIIIVNFIVDFIFYLQEENSVLALFRIVLNIGFVGLVILKNKKSSKNLFTPLFITIIYSSFLLFFSSEIYSSVIEFSKYATTLLFLPVAYYLINSKEKLKEFINSVYIILPLYTLFVLISNLYKVGSIRYSNENAEVFRVALGDAKLYAPAILVGMLPILIKNNLIVRKKIYALFGLINFLLLILTMRRTAVFIIIFIPLFYYVLSGNIKTIVTTSVGVGLFLLISFPLIQDQFNDRLSERNYLTESDYSYEKEGRYLELGLVLNTFYNSDNIFNYLFGVEAFYTLGNYGFISKDRPIHSDYTYILFSTGIIGLILYVFIYANISRRIMRVKNELYLKGLKNDYKLFITLLILVIIIGVSGNIWAITFKSFTFSVLGAFLGFFFSSIKKTVI